MTSGPPPAQAQTLADFWAEVREVATEIQPESVIVLQVDAAVQDAADYAACDLPDEIVIKGRGGTDFRPGFAWLDEQGIRPPCASISPTCCVPATPTPSPNFRWSGRTTRSPPATGTASPGGERIDIAPDRRSPP